MSRVLVVFVPEVGGQQGLSSGRGVTDANGRFVLIDEQGTERIKTGPYYITLEDLAVYDKPRNELPAHITQDSTPELATMYRQVGSTPLCYDVQTGRQSIVIDLQTNTVRVDDVSVSPEHVSDTGKNRPPHQQ